MIITVINGVVIEAETLQDAYYTEIKIVRKPYFPLNKKKK